VTDHRDQHEPYSITPPPEVTAFALRLAQQVAEWREKCALALESSRLSEEEVRRLRARCDMEVSHIAELKEQIKMLRAERDEARRDLCMEWVWRGRNYRMQNGHKFKPSAEDWATISNWDCFRDTMKQP
jgi:hypothetical protein